MRTSPIPTGSVRTSLSPHAQPSWAHSTALQRKKHGPTGSHTPDGNSAKLSPHVCGGAAPRLAQPPQLPQPQSQQQQQPPVSAWRSGSLGSRGNCGRASFTCTQGMTPVSSFQPVAGHSPVPSQKLLNVPTPQANEATFSTMREDPTTSSSTRRMPMRADVERVPRATSLEEPRRHMAQLHAGPAGSRSPCPGRQSPCPLSRSILPHRANGLEKNLAGSIGTVASLGGDRSLAGSITSTIPQGASVGALSPGGDSRLRQAMLHEMDIQTVAVQGACKQTAALLQSSHKFAVVDPLKENSNSHLGLDLAAALLSAAQALHEDAADSLNKTAPSSSSTNTALAALQAHIKEQQRYQTGLLDNLSEQWELRFATIEKALSNGLEGASAASAQMNERSGRFVHLAEGIEHAMNKAVGTTKEVSNLAQDVKKVEEDLACLAEELASEKAERQRTLVAMGQQAEHQVACLCAKIKDDLLCLVGGSNGAMGDDGLAQIDRLNTEVREERAERRQLVAEWRTTANETEQLKRLLASTTEYLFSLSHELVAGKGVNGNHSQPTGRKLEYAQRLESLGNELRGELAGRPCGTSPGRVDEVHQENNDCEVGTSGPSPSKLPSTRSVPGPLLHNSGFSSSPAIGRISEDGEQNAGDCISSLDGSLSRDVPKQHEEGLTQSIVAMLQSDTCA